VLASPWFTDAQFGMLAATPMNRQHDLARVVVDIDNDVGDQCPQQLLSGTHRYVRRMPCCRQIIRQVREGARVDLEG
jgi:hypothetical protein